MSEGFDPDEVLARLDAEEYLPRSEKLARLSADAHAAADWIVERNLEIVAHSLRTEPPEETPCALCIMPMYFTEQGPLEERLGREIDPLHVEVLAVDTHAARRTGDAFRDRVVDAWLGIDWADVRYPNLRSPDFRLNDEPPVVVTPDFVAYFQDDDFDPWPPTIIRHLGRPSAVALLDEQELLPPP